MDREQCYNIIATKYILLHWSRDTWQPPNYGKAYKILLFTDMSVNCQTKGEGSDYQYSGGEEGGSRLHFLTWEADFLHEALICDLLSGLTLKFATYGD